MKLTIKSKIKLNLPDYVDRHRKQRDNSRVLLRFAAEAVTLILCRNLRKPKFGWTLISSKCELKLIDGVKKII